jgi:hypothetical protein
MKVTKPMSAEIVDKVISIEDDLKRLASNLGQLPVNVNDAEARYKDFKCLDAVQSLVADVVNLRETIEAS